MNKERKASEKLRSDHIVLLEKLEKYKKENDELKKKMQPSEKEPIEAFVEEEENSPSHDNESNSKLLELESRLTGYEKEIKTYKSRIGALEGENRRLNSVLQSTKEQCTQLSNKMAELTRNAEMVELQNSELKVSLMSFEKKLCDKDYDLIIKEKAASSELQNVLFLQNELSEWKTQYVALEKEYQKVCCDSEKNWNLYCDMKQFSENKLIQLLESNEKSSFELNSRLREKDLRIENLERQYSSLQEELLVARLTTISATSMCPCQCTSKEPSKLSEEIVSRALDSNSSSIDSKDVSFAEFVALRKENRLLRTQIASIIDNNKVNMKLSAPHEATLFPNIGSSGAGGTISAIGATRRSKSVKKF